MKKHKHLGSSLATLAAKAVRSDPDFAEALLQEAAQALLNNETDVARSLIRDVIKGAIGYAELSKRTGTPETSLVRMFGPKGNPTAANLCNVLAHLQKKIRVRFEVRVVRARGKSGLKRSAHSLRRAA